MVLTDPEDPGIETSVADQEKVRFEVKMYCSKLKFNSA